MRALQSYGQISYSYNAPDEDNWTVRVLEGQAEDAEAKQVRQALAEDAQEAMDRAPGDAYGQGHHAPVESYDFNPGGEW